MENVQLQANYNRQTNNFVLNIKNGSKETLHMFDNAEQVEKFTKNKTGIEISYNYQQNRFEIPVKNQFDF